MSLITRMRKQTAVYWALLEELDSSGNPVWAAPIQVPVRWEETEGEIGERRYAPILYYKATVYVDRDMRAWDYLMLGTLTSSTPPDPRDAQSWEVDVFKNIPNIRATEFLRIAECAPAHLTFQAKHGLGVESITYKRVTALTTSVGGIVTPTITSSAIAVAIKGRPDEKEMEKIQKSGDFATTVATWDIPRRLLPLEPKLNDYLLDTVGARWNVLDWELAPLRSWWRVTTRRSQT